MSVCCDAAQANAVTGWNGCNLHACLCFGHSSNVWSPSAESEGLLLPCLWWHQQGGKLPLHGCAESCPAVWGHQSGILQQNSPDEKGACTYKDALSGDISDDLIPFSDSEVSCKQYVLELWQSEWVEFPENKLHKIFPDLKDCTLCPQTNRWEETMISLTAHWLLLYYSFLFIEGRGATNMYCMWWATNWERTSLFCSDFIEIRETFYSSVTADVIQGHIFNFLKEINIFWQNINFQIIFGSVCFTHFSNLFLKIWLYTSLVFIVCWQNVFRPDITILVDWV